jgi:hypothetical protein
MIRSIVPDRPSAHVTRESAKRRRSCCVIAAVESRWREWNEEQLSAAGDLFQRRVDPLTGAEMVWPESVGRSFTAQRKRGEGLSS